MDGQTRFFKSHAVVIGAIGGVYVCQIVPKKYFYLPTCARPAFYTCLYVKLVVHNLTFVFVEVLGNRLKDNVLVELRSLFPYSDVVS
uniref:Uncharacterized protein n=1 Tax=Megaselia scalaris TaxID=36166 RepID=T1GGN9_MEGSC